MNTKNFNSLTIGQRVTLGFALLLLIGSGLGGFAAWKMASAADGAEFLSAAVAPQAEVSSTLAQASLSAQREVVRYSFNGDASALAESKRFLRSVNAALRQAKQLSKDQPRLTALMTAEAEAADALAKYETEVTATEENLTQLAEIRLSLDESAAVFIKQLDLFIVDQNEKLDREFDDGAPAAALHDRQDKIARAREILDLGSSIRVSNFKGQAVNDLATLESILPLFDEMEKIRVKLQASLNDAANVRQVEAIGTAAATYHAGIAAVVANFTQAAKIATARAAAADRFDEVTSGVLSVSISRTVDYANRAHTQLNASSQGLTAGLMMMVIAGVVGAFFIIRSVNRALSATSEQLSQGSMQVAAAAGQVSSASQSLAEGASEQAASLEEISSSIEELSSTTKRNAENAQNGKKSAAQAREAAETGATEMAQMQQAMAAIQDSSTDISKIIKTIDEIAFQTNILALNAAVEAARAGEAGAGFAVVADEVRNLAQRSAVAAKETANKIADAMSRSEQGVDISGRVAAGLEQILMRAREVDGLVAEVAVASQEQSEGLDQINSAITQMDQVTQSSAANAEESASAAEELNAQSEELRSASEQLAKMVGLKITVSAKAAPTQSHAASSSSTPSFSPKPVPYNNGRNGKLMSAIPVEELSFRN